jgi:Spy/CpxP family protein refolding chaperone
VLDDLKTERAQGAVDHRRTTAAFADAIGGAAFDEKAVGDAASARVTSATRLRDAVVKALGRIHALLDPDQRAKLAYLLRTGALSI